MRFQHLFSLIFLSIIHQYVNAQQAHGILEGQVLDLKSKPIVGVHIFLKNKPKQGTYSDSTGHFKFKIGLGTQHIVISHVGFLIEERHIVVQRNKTQSLKIGLISKSEVLDAVEVKSQKEDDRKQVSMIRLNPVQIKKIPVPFDDFTQAIAMVGLGISNNNDLSSSYSVRGGNFDENLIYVNQIQIYRPFLVRSGQQEGLSFINPDFVESVSFSAGGWEAKYGDKLSSVLNIKYKTPQQFNATATVGLLGGRAFLEGVTKNKRIGWLIGFRNKSSRYLLNTLETNGEYLPNFSDFQNMLHVDLGSKKRTDRGLKTNLSILTSYARNRYLVRPQSRQTDYGTFNKVIRLYVNFHGQEVLHFDTQQIGLKLSHEFSKRFTSNLILSAMKTSEREYVDTEGAYQLCDIDIDLSSKNFNQCSFVRGAETLGKYARNKLNANIIAFQNQNQFQINTDHKIEFGTRFSFENITDKIQQYDYTDSTNYVQVTERLYTGFELKTKHFTTYAQYTGRFKNHHFTLGARVGYRNLNNQWIFSPRLQYAYTPNWVHDIVFNMAIGVYQQPPFYREMRDFKGVLHQNLKAQKSIHAIFGADYAFEMWGRPFKLMTEAYLKKMNHVVPYDIDNVRIRYYANNDAQARIVGTDLRLSGEFILGTESWVNLSILSAQENIITDQQGWIRRPTDQRANLVVFFEDYIPNRPSLRVNMRIMYGTGLPFGPPNQKKYRSVYSGDAYRRVDIGFFKIIENKKHFKNLRAGIEILNILGANNVISYLWISDYLDNQYAVPNGLSQRFFNLKLTASF